MDAACQSQDRDIYNQEGDEPKRILRKCRVVSVEKELRIDVSVDGSVKLEECMKASPSESIKRERFDVENVAAPDIAVNYPETLYIDCQGMAVKQETEVKIETPEELEELSYEFTQEEECDCPPSWQPANVQQCNSASDSTLPDLQTSCGTPTTCATDVKESVLWGLNLTGDQSSQLKASTDLTPLKETSCGSSCVFGDKKFACNQCSYMTNFKNRFNQHFITHVREKRYACDQCSFRTKCRYYLSKHCLSHSAEKKFACNHCPFKTNIKSHLTQHCFIHEKEKRFGCDQCSYQTNFKYSLKLHFLNHHTNSREKQFVCDQCSYKTNNKGNLKIHCLSHSKEKQFACDQCSYKTNIKSNLRIHCLSHSKEKQYACDQCSYKTYNKGNLKQHSFTHSKENQFACDQCSFKTNYRSYLKRHCTSHSKEKRFACDQCLYKTNNENNFKGHYRTHTAHTLSLIE